ncbi:MAG TPA: hypothetical protein VHU22_03000 [Xanthobacteraceae bacterium]|nr:hypothetical protein [Xanthobacteraceae bacterium]
MTTHGTLPSDYLSDQFLDRVRRAYRSANANGSSPDGTMWSQIDERRADVHRALMASNNEALREIFADPTKTDLYYGTDQLCRSMNGPLFRDSFVETALGNDRGQIARYCTNRLLDLLAACPERSAIEIGPGMGRTAYFTFTAGVTDYTTIDLPLGVVAQACFLGRTLGPDNLWFANEAESLAANRIKLLFAGALPRRRFSVAINVDSLPEFFLPEAFACARWLSKHADAFLSINHEKSHFTVAETVRFARGMRRNLRCECPAWPGYIEEVYQPDGRRALAPALQLRAFHYLTLARTKFMRRRGGDR